jgi:hypothetical protein
MNGEKLIVLCGNSLLMDTVEANLDEERANVGIMRIDVTDFPLDQHLASLAPDMVIFDWDLPNLQFILPLMRNRPEIPIIGVEIKCNQVAVLTCHRHNALNATELSRIVKRYLPTTSEITVEEKIEWIHRTINRLATD